MLFGTSGVKLLRTASNMAGLKGLPISRTVLSLFFSLELLDGTSKSDKKSAKAVKVGYPTYQIKAKHRHILVESIDNFIFTHLKTF